MQTLKYFSPQMSLTLMLKCTFLQHSSFYVQQSKAFLNMLPVTSKLMSLRPHPGGTDSQFHRRKEYRKSFKLLKLMGDLRKEETYITLFGFFFFLIWVSFKATKLEDSWKSWSNILQLFISWLIETERQRTACTESTCCIPQGSWGKCMVVGRKCLLFLKASRYLPFYWFLIFTYS